MRGDKRVVRRCTTPSPQSRCSPVTSSCPSSQCRELRGFIRPLAELLEGLRRGRYDRGGCPPHPLSPPPGAFFPWRTHTISNVPRAEQLPTERGHGPAPADHRGPAEARNGVSVPRRPRGTRVSPSAEGDRSSLSLPAVPGTWGRCCRWRRCCGSGSPTSPPNPRWIQPPPQLPRAAAPPPVPPGLPGAAACPRSSPGTCPWPAPRGRQARSSSGGPPSARQGPPSPPRRRTCDTPPGSGGGKILVCISWFCLF